MKHPLALRLILLFLTGLLVLTLWPAASVQAEGITGQISASSSSVAVGSTLTVAFSAVPAVTVTAYQVTISFDPSKFDFVSGQDLTGLNGGNSIDNNGSSISVYAYGDSGVANISKLCRLTFKAKAEGSGVFTTSGAVINDQSPAGSAVSVAVTAAGVPAETTATTTATTTAATEALPEAEATIEFADGSYQITALPTDFETPAGFYRTAITIGGQKMEAFKSAKGDLVLLYLSSDFGGTNLYFYDSNANSVYLYSPFSVSGHDFVLVRPDASAIVPAGFSSTSLTLDGQTISCWVKSDLTGESDPYAGTYLLYLMDEQGQKGFFLYQPENQMIFPYVMLDYELPEQTTESSVVETQVTTPTESVTTETRSANQFDLWMILTFVFGVVSLLLSVFLIWTYFEYIRPLENGQNPIQPTAPPKPPKIRRVD